MKTDHPLGFQDLSGTVPHVAMPDPTASAPRRRRGPYAKTAARQQQIVDAAIEVFATQGFRASSLREVAARVGLSQAGLLHHFGSKEALLVAVLESRERSSLSRAEGLSAVDALRALVADSVANPGLIRLFTVLSAEATDPEHPAHEWVTRRYAATRHEFTEALRQLQAEGGLSRDADPAAVAAQTVAVFDGLQLQWLLNPTLDLVAAVDHYIATLEAAYGPSPDRPT